MLAVGGLIISYGFLTNQVEDTSINISPYENLQNYKEELEKINQYNQEILEELEQTVSDYDTVDLDQIHEEIEVLKQVIKDNKAELNLVTQKLSEMKSNP